MSNDQQRSDQSGRPQDSREDTQALIGLLENLVPLLMRFQTDAFGHQGAAYIGGGSAAQLEHQAAVAFTEDIILESLRNVSAYLQKNAGRYPGLDTYNGVVEQARRAFDARDYQSALALILQAYRAVAVIRSIRPELPPIRERTQGEQNGSGKAMH
ncbi:hypothetical protein [Hyphomicrobium sp.]|jgi:hypothetical protein|uniref:hypothetical protein n=1 Tax=Hyphomicrobium sp. TaxID=82 RepID=UPI00356728B2